MQIYFSQKMDYATLLEMMIEEINHFRITHKNVSYDAINLLRIYLNSFTNETLFSGVN